MHSSCQAGAAGGMLTAVKRPQDERAQKPCASLKIGSSPGLVVRENGRPQGTAPYPMGVVFSWVEVPPSGMLGYDRTCRRKGRDVLNYDRRVGDGAGRQHLYSGQVLPLGEDDNVLRSGQ